MTTDAILKLEKLIKAPRDKVFDAWINPEVMPKWFGPEGVHVPEFSMDVREGGKWNAVMENGDGERYYVSGVYTEITPHDRLAFTWAWSEDGVRGPESHVSLTFGDVDGGTVMTVEHTNLDSKESRTNHQEGWDSSNTCLAKYLESN